MKRLITVLVVLILLTGSIPTLSGPDYEDYRTYSEYRKDLYKLQNDITLVP